MEPVLWIVTCLLFVAFVVTMALLVGARGDLGWWRTYAQWLLEHHLDLKRSTAAATEPPAPKSDAEVAQDYSISLHRERYPL